MQFAPLKDVQANEEKAVHPDRNVVGRSAGEPVGRPVKTETEYATHSVNWKPAGRNQFSGLLVEKG